VAMLILKAMVDRGRLELAAMLLLLCSQVCAFVSHPPQPGGVLRWPTTLAGVHSHPSSVGGLERD
jgi:hypothetical protein